MARASALAQRGDGAGVRILAALGTLLCAVNAPATAQRGLQSQSATVQLSVTVPAAEERSLRLPGLRLGEHFQREPHDTVLIDPRLGRVAIRVDQARGGRAGPRSVQVVWQ
jgi:hypothetical protein